MQFHLSACRMIISVLLKFLCVIMWMDPVALVGGSLLPFPTPLEELELIQSECTAKGFQGFQEAIVKLNKFYKMVLILN